MSGRWLTLKQVGIYMESRKAGKSQVASAARASISERSGREIEKGRREEPHVKIRHWRTRKDVFSSVWSNELELLLQASPTLSPLTLLEHLQTSYGNTIYPDSLLRTLQRKVKAWRYEKGPAQEVIFRQEHIPGHMGLSDFTVLKNIVVSIQGKPLKHILYHFRVLYSGWSYMEVILGGESYTALAQGLQNALWALGGSPKEHRTDSLAAAYKNITLDEKQDVTQQYQDFCGHYNMLPSRNNKGVSHENGGIESPHGHIKTRIAQAFLLRGSYDFDSLEDYNQWIGQVVNTHNRRNAKRVEEEKMALQSLPCFKTADYTVLPVKVSTSSTIQVRKSLYSVPSRLIGASLQVHLYHDHLDCYHGGKRLAQLDRVYPQGGSGRAKNIDYKHVIDSLIKKPMAFFRSQHQEALLPNARYKKIWQRLANSQPSRDASKLMVGLLHLAATADCEKNLGEQVMDLLDKGDIPVLADLRRAYGQMPSRDYLAITSEQHEIISYNDLIPSSQGDAYAIH
jgi:transposase InsO family protein